MRHYANPDEDCFTGSLFIFHFGAYGDTEVAVYQRPGHLEAALDTAAEWLAENAPGLFNEPDYECACVELELPSAEFISGEMSPEDIERVTSLAEADLTYTESGWLASWEWTVDEIEGDDLPPATFAPTDTSS